MDGGYGGYGPGNYGENIWDVSSWTTDILWKDSHLRQYFDSLQFLDCVREIVDLAETYFTSVYQVYSEEEEDGVELDFPLLDIIVLMTEEYLYGHLFAVITPLQELSLLEILCSYFQSNTLDPIRYLVFDCFFGFPSETTELQKGLMEQKTSLMSKLTSIAIGTQCGNVLNCVAVWFHTYGSHNKRAAKVAFAVVNDYFFVCPNSSKAVDNLIDVAPVFAYQFLVALAGYYKDPSLQLGGDIKSRIPPILLVQMISEWLTERPRFCVVKIPQVFLQLPSIHNFHFSKQDNAFLSCPIFYIAPWCYLEPFLRPSKEDRLYDGSESAAVFSKLLYGFLNFMSMQKKVELNKNDSQDDLEPGELSDEENENFEIITKDDLVYLISILKKYLKDYADFDQQRKEESIDRLLQIVQLAKWSGCVIIKGRELNHLLQGIPRTKLLDIVLNCGN